MNNSKCNLCPRKCNVDREKKLGYCMAPNKIVVANASLYFFEEPCISGNKGSGTIFFSYCNLKCIFCQNYEISIEHVGKEITIEKLSNICLVLQRKGALNINLVTPTCYINFIIDAIKLAKENGLKLPIVYNTSGYETVETIKLLKGTVDIYLPDIKYYSDEKAIKYSNAPNYFKIATSALQEMYNQVGKAKFNKDNIMIKGVLVRHLMLPNMKEDSKKIIEYLYNTYKDNIYISIMNQYTPMKKYKFNELNQTIDNNSYDEVINYAYDLGVRNAYIQEGGTCDKSFIPDFKSQNF